MGKHPHDLAQEAARRFGERLEPALEQLEMTPAGLAKAAAIDDSTVRRIIRGDNVPSYKIAVTIFCVLFKVNRLVAYELGRELFELSLDPERVPDADYTGDGKEDRDDLLPCAAHMNHAVDQVTMLALDALGNDGRIDNPELMKITSALLELRDHASAFRKLVELENARWAVKK